MFNPGLEIGQILKNADIVEKFKCGNMGGMRRSKTTNTLVIVSDYTKGLYHDKWIGGVLHYTGMLWSSIFVTLLTVKIMFFTSVRIVLQKVFYNYYTNAVSHDCM